MPESPTPTLATRWPTITKRRPMEAVGTVTPNLVDYDQACAEFSWPRERAELDGLPGGRGLNIAHEAVDRHAAGPRRNRIALGCLSRGGELLAFARVRLGAAVAPKEIDFRLSIPKNRAGKIMRRLLRARELGLPEGDISTLEVS